MPLTSGTQLGPYEIHSQLGAGGMGEVYRARDTRLGRDVAIKVLPEHLSSSPELKERFEREARAISSLNHPRICTLHDIGHQDGVDFLVMEYIEGASLAERLKKGPLPLKEALKVGMDVCEALEAAHRAGIVHRDLKPGNIMLTKSGAKLMDFGLAKSAEAGLDAAAPPLLSGARTLSGPSPLSPLTTAGAVVGTIQYMSPEQIEGKKADARSDIFALGAVLYEMATGKRPFEGKSQISLASAILEKDPEPISALQPLTPPAFERIVTICLAKNPDDRFQTAHDVRLALEWIADDTFQPPRPEVTKAVPRFVPLLLAGTIVALVAGFLLSQRKPPQPHYTTVTFRQGVLQAARFSHDGETIIYSGEWEGAPPQVAIARVGSPESRPLGISTATVAAVSSSDEVAVLRDCESIFLLDCGGTLATVSLAGGSPRDIAGHVAYADWTRDAKQLAVSIISAERTRIEFPLGHVLYQQKAGWLAHPRFSPDGTRIAYENHPSFGGDDGSIEAIDLTGKRTVLSAGWLSLEGLAWSPDGQEVWFAGSNGSGGWADAIHAVTLTGKERVVLTLPSVRLHDISRDGRVLLSHESWRRQLSGLFPGDAAEHPYSWLDSPTPTAISADGRWLSFYEGGEVYNIERDYLAYYRRTDGSAAVRLGAGTDVVSPDGKLLLAFNLKDGALLLQPNGPGTSQKLPTPGLVDFAHASWSDDGRRIVYEAQTQPGDWNIYAQSIAGGPPVMVRSGGRNSYPILSADGGMVALREEHGGVSLYRMDGGQPIAVKGVLSSELPIRFLDAGKELLLVDANGRELVLSRVDLATGRRIHWKRFPSESRLNELMFVTTPDLKYYAYSSPRYASDLYIVENLR
jgi:eukaryotic-like serine/threonine-protein kinase